MGVGESPEVPEGEDTPSTPAGRSKGNGNGSDRKAAAAAKRVGPSTIRKRGGDSDVAVSDHPRDGQKTRG